MKMKKGMRILSLLMVIALLGAIFVPAVSAVEQKGISLENISERLIVTEVFDSQKIQIKAPIKESEIVSFIFSENWLLKNNMDEESDIIKLTIPKTEITKLSISKDFSDLRVVGQIEKDEPVVLLQIPKDIFELNNQESDQYTLDYPRDYYSFFSDVNKLLKEIEKRKSLSESEQTERIEINPNFEKLSKSLATTMYADWACYNTNWFQYPKAIRGDIKPNTFSNSGQLFSLYHEREIYLDRNGDVIELVLWYTDFGSIYLSAALYDEGQLKWGNGGVPSGTWIDASSMNKFCYEVYINTNGQYEIKFLNTGTGQWYSFTYNDADNASGHISGITGSSELTLYGAQTDNFMITTQNMRDYGVKDSISGSWIAPTSRFTWDRYKNKNSGLYTYMNSWQNGDTIYTYHRASDTDT